MKKKVEKTCTEIANLQSYVKELNRIIHCCKHKRFSEIENNNTYIFANKEARYKGVAVIAWLKTFKKDVKSTLEDKKLQLKILKLYIRKNKLEEQLFQVKQNEHQNPRDNCYTYGWKKAAQLNIAKSVNMAKEINSIRKKISNLEQQRQVSTSIAS